MHIFVTGASGFVGSAVAAKLIGDGHSVSGLARSDASAAAQEAARIAVRRGDVADLDLLASAARAADGVIHCAFNHDFGAYGAAAAADKAAIATFGAVLAGTGKPLIVTGGIHGRPDGTPAEEDDEVPASPRASEAAAMALLGTDVRVMVIRLGRSVHGDGDKGFVPTLIGIARQKGVAAYVGDGANRWPTVYRGDAAELYRLALAKGVAGARYHGVGEEGVALRDIAGVIGTKLGVPVRSIAAEEAPAHFGWMAAFNQSDAPASNLLTRQRLGWAPTGLGLIEDLEKGTYFD